VGRDEWPELSVDTVRGGGMEEGGGAPLHHPLCVSNIVVAAAATAWASTSTSVFVDIDGSTPHTQQAVVRHQREVVVLCTPHR
jgi:hypothetical protein